ncbi:MAG TPA: sodium-independent anion transporter, partial [Leifsonia sp.]
GGINFIDAQGAATLADIVTLARDAGVRLRLTRLKPGPRAVLDREGVIGLIGADHIHGNIHRAVEAERNDAGGP